MVKFTLFFLVGGGQCKVSSSWYDFERSLIVHWLQVIIEGIRLPISVAIWVEL